jgi:arylsulfatase A-like enzyme
MAPRTPSFNEADMSDKPRWFRENLTPMSEADIAAVDASYRDRLRSMRGVEDILEQVDAALAQVGQLESAYLVVISDHGFHQGHHRFRRGKDTAYEPAIRIPLLMRGPGIPVGQRREHLVTNVDLPMTLAELAGAPVPPWVDGRSLVPLLGETPPAVQDWRTSVLLEHPPVSEDDLGIPGWWGLRTLDSSYVEYVTGEREYYDLLRDPDQLESLHDRADPALLQELQELLATKLECGGADCG